MSPVELVADPTQPFAGKVALVTGAARPRGIGRATALRLAQGGADVACLDIARPYTDAPAHGTASGDDLDSIVADTEALGRKAIAVQLGRTAGWGREGSYVWISAFDGPFKNKK